MTNGDHAAEDSTSEAARYARSRPKRMLHWPMRRLQEDTQCHSPRHNLSPLNGEEL